MTGVVNIIGDIGYDVNLIDVVQQVERQSDATEFICNISTHGGYVHEGFDIYHYLKSLRKPIHMVGRGVVASIGTVIFMAGSTREVLDGTDFMIHLPYMIDDSPKNASDLAYDAKELARIEKTIVDFYQKTTKLKGIALKRFLEKETYLDEEQLYDFGFTTEKQSVKAVAKLIINKKNEKMSKKGSALARLRNLFSKFEMKTLKTADLGDLIFQGVDDNEEPQIGDKATIDGEPAYGEILLADGRIFVFDENGVLIEKKEEALALEDEDIDALEEKLDEVLEAVDDVVQEAVEEVAEVVEEVVEEVQAKLVEMRKLKSEMDKLKGVNSKRMSRQPRNLKRTEGKENDLVKAFVNLKNKKK